MKILITIARIIVGLLFIFSGLVKANDPLGLSYKMQEFFEVWGLHGFDSWTLLMSVLMNAFEIIAGAALLLGWRIKLFSRLLLLLILFFTFLTGYTYFTGQPTNCGCFGDCLPISSKTSFIKDIGLLLLIGLIFWKQKLIKPFLPTWLTIVKIASVTIFAFGFQWYTLAYLPVVDCLPYQKRNNITDKMKMPPNAIPDSTVITFVYEKAGQQTEFTADNFPEDFNNADYKLIKRYDRLVRKGSNNEPPIKGFSLTEPGILDTLTGEIKSNDYTDIVLSKPYSLLLIGEDPSVSFPKWVSKFSKIYAQAKEKNIPVYVVTSFRDSFLKISASKFGDIHVLNCDYKAILTAARTNPCLYLLQDGTVLNKWSWKCMEDVKNDLNNIPKQTKNASSVEQVPDSDINQPVSSN